MLKLKIFDKEIRNTIEYLFSSFEELYCDLLNTRYLSTDCDYLTEYILDKFNIKESVWNQFFNDLNEKNLDTDYYTDFDKFLKINNINYSIDDLTDQDFYNIINDNLSINGSYKYFYQIENSNIEIDTFLIKFFDESGNNIIENLKFCENLLNKELPTLLHRQKFLLLFNQTIEEHPGHYIDNLFNKYCVVIGNKIYNSENDTYIYISGLDYNIYDYDYNECNYKKFLANYKVNGNSKEWIFYAKYKTDICELLFNYKIHLEDEKKSNILSVSEIN